MEEASSSKTLEAIGKRLQSQDNRCTQNPMFCVQILRRDVGYDPDYASEVCWKNQYDCEDVIYDDDPNFEEPSGDEWEQFGYVDRWETVMVAFTEKGCEEFLELDGHNVRRRAFRGQVRIFVESFNRCPEMIAIREFLKNQA